LCYIDGVSEEQRRIQGINLSSGAVNAVEVAVGLFNVPELSQWEKQFESDMNLTIENMT